MAVVVRKRAAPTTAVDSSPGAGSTASSPTGTRSDADDVKDVDEDDDKDDEDISGECCETLFAESFSASARFFTAKKTVYRWGP
jgi:hypothetical protein